MSEEDSLPNNVAAIDLGSNSFHMIICNLTDGKLQTVDRLKEMVRLAEGLDEHGNLDPEVQKRALDCLQRFGQRIRNFPDERVSIVGTNTLRTAKNAEDFMTKAERALGHPIHVISGIEEARLIYQGVANSLGSHANKRLVMDIGGGSTEYIIGKDDTPLTKESLRMGCVSFSQLFFKHGKLSKKRFKKAVLLAEQRLEPFQQKFHRQQWDEAIGASGSLKAIRNVLHEAGWSNNGITKNGLNKLVDTLLNYDDIDDVPLPGLSDERRPVFAGAVAIIYATFQMLDIDQMTVSDGALREGLVHDLLGRLYNHDIRSETSRTLAEYYHVDQRHATNLKKTIDYMLEQLSPQSRLFQNSEARQFLHWAAELHEIGRGIAHSGYHKHSAYIIENGDLAGFSRQDQALLAAMVKTHRKRFRKSRFKHLHTPWNEKAPLMTLILRLSVLLHRNRYSQCPEFSLKVDKQHILLDFCNQWLQQAPLTQADLEKEAAYLHDAGFYLEFI